MSKERLSSAVVLREAMARTPLPAVLTDADGRVLFANQHACSVLGLAGEGEGWERGEADEDDHGVLDIRLNGRVTGGDDGWHPLGVTDFGVSAADGRRGKVWARLETKEGGPETALTPREREILGLIAAGLRTEEIAGRLSLSPETIKSHIHNAMQKLRAHTRSQAVAIAISTGQVSYTGRSSAA